MEHGLTNDYLSETITDRNIIQMGQKLIVVADHTKFGRISTVFVVPIERVNTLVTTSETPVEFIQNLKDKGINVLLASELFP